MFSPARLLLSASAIILVAAAAPAQFRFFIPSDIPIQEEEPAAEAAFTQAVSGQSGDFGVKIELEVSREGAPFRVVALGTPICNGDHVAFRFTPSAQGYAAVVNHGTSGTWSRIWPARDWEDPSFGPQRPVRIPAQEGAGFPLSGPAGDEYVMIFFSPGPFSEELKTLQEQVMGWGGPSATTPTTPAQADTRATTVTLMRDLGTSQMAYAVGQGEQTVAFALNHQETCGELR